MHRYFYAWNENKSKTHKCKTQRTRIKVARLSFGKTVFGHWIHFISPCTIRSIAGLLICLRTQENRPCLALPSGHTRWDRGYTVPGYHSEAANAHGCHTARLVLSVKVMRYRGFFFFFDLCGRKDVGGIGLDLMSLKWVNWQKSKLLISVTSLKRDSWKHPLKKKKKIFSLECSSANGHQMLLCCQRRWQFKAAIRLQGANGGTGTKLTFRIFQTSPNEA